MVNIAHAVDSRPIHWGMHHMAKAKYDRRWFLANSLVTALEDRKDVDCELREIARALSRECGYEPPPRRDD